MSCIALMVPELLAGGAQRVMLLLSRELVARGHRVILVLVQARGPLMQAVPQNVQIISLTSGGRSANVLSLALAATWRLATWLRREQPDVMLSTVTGTNLIAVLARSISRARTRLVLREAVTLDNVHNPLRMRVMRFLYPRADAVVALSTTMLEQLQHRLGIPANQLCCIPNPVDVEAVRRSALAHLDLPWKDDFTGVILVSVGRLIPQKDHANLIRAFALLLETIPARLIIVGDGPERQALEELAGVLGVAGQMHFAGFDVNPWRWMARAQVFVLSSRWEGHPNVLLEAEALGLSIVSTEYDPSVHNVLSSMSHMPYRIVKAARPELLAAGIIGLLETVRERPIRLAEVIGNTKAVDAYEDLLVGDNRTI